MSNYQGFALNPASQLIEKASFIDDYYGHHRYGVVFSDASVYPEHQLVTLHPNTVLGENTIRASYQNHQSEVDLEEDYWWGTMTGIKDILPFGGKTLEDSLYSFIASVDEYKEDLK